MNSGKKSARRRSRIPSRRLLATSSSRSLTTALYSVLVALAVMTTMLTLRTRTMSPRFVLFGPHAEALVLRPRRARHARTTRLSYHPAYHHHHHDKHWSRATVTSIRGGGGDSNEKEPQNESSIHPRGLLSRFRGKSKFHTDTESSKQSAERRQETTATTATTTLEKGGGDDDDDDTASTVSSSSLSSVSSLFRSSSWRQLGTSWSRILRRRAGEVLTLGGFVSSATMSLYTHRRGQWKRLQPTVDALTDFLRESALDTQLSESILNVRLLDNLVLLSRIQKLVHAEQSAPERAAWTDDAWSSKIVVPTAAQALRYMKFATAAYGNAMIRAAQLDVEGKYDSLWQSSSLFSFSNGTTAAPTTTLRVISQHVGVPEADLVLLDIDYTGSDEHLRHFVAVDHAHQEIILSLRGTFSLAEIVQDAAAFAIPFCSNGQAHAEMAKQAEIIWQRTGPEVVKLCETYPDYTLILTGHSLGAGTACLLHLLLHENTNKGNTDVPTPPNPLRCIAFASPPVYANPSPSSSIQRAIRSCVNFVHGHDLVPFLSVASVRRLMAELAWVQEKTRHLRYRDRLALFWGYRPIDPEWVDEFHRQEHTSLRVDPLPGAPILSIPAALNVWLTPYPSFTASTATTSSNDSSNGSSDSAATSDDDYDPNVYYQAHRCDSHKMATLIGVQVDLNMLQDHFPARYAHALHHFHPNACI